MACFEHHRTKRSPHVTHKPPSTSPWLVAAMSALLLGLLVASSSGQNLFSESAALGTSTLRDVPDVTITTGSRIHLNLSTSAGGDCQALDLALASGLTLPDWLHFDRPRCLLYGVPLQTADVGTHYLTLTRPETNERAVFLVRVDEPLKRTTKQDCYQLDAVFKLAPRAGLAPLSSTALVRLALMDAIAAALEEPAEHIRLTHWEISAGLPTLGWQLTCASPYSQKFVTMSNALTGARAAFHANDTLTVRDDCGCPWGHKVSALSWMCVCVCVCVCVRVRVRYVCLHVCCVFVVKFDSFRFFPPPTHLHARSSLCKALNPGQSQYTIVEIASLAVHRMRGALSPTPTPEPEPEQILHQPSKAQHAVYRRQVSSALFTATPTLLPSVTLQPSSSLFSPAISTTAAEPSPTLALPSSSELLPGPSSTLVGPGPLPSSGVLVC
jgi:hypothetical protein